MLTAATRSVWAKTDQFHGSDSGLSAWLPLPQHLDDALGIAELLWDEWVPERIRASLAEAAGSMMAARSLLAFLAGCHDVGKASPAFAVQVPELADRMGEVGLRSPVWLQGAPERLNVRHELVSYYALLDWCGAAGRLPASTARQLASVVGAHHGTAPQSHTVQAMKHAEQLVGSGPWADARAELIDWAARRSGILPHLPGISAQPVPQTVLVQLSGLVIVADWLASSEDFFPLFPVDDTPDVDQGARVEAAWQRADLPGRWQPRAEPRDTDGFFESRFSLPPGAAPNLIQREAVRIAREQREPTLMIVEAAMGEGKTETALACAEILAEQTGAGGVFIGMPTQATTDSMFARALSWAETLGTDSSVFLAHGKSGLNPEFERLRAAGRGVNIAPEGAPDPLGRGDRVTANRWLSDRRKGPLANLVVGTIDQLLFTALSSRHLMLRHLGFSHKVVIIDEAHAYDVYMSRFLDRAVEWLGAYGASVVILSATLPAARRIGLLDAYAVGKARAAGERVSPRRAARLDRYAALQGDIGYPVIVTGQGDAAPRVSLPGAGADPGKKPRPGVQLRRIGDGPAEIVETLRSELAEGGCAAVIHNTVRRVGETAAALRAAFPDAEILVAHAQFLASDRVRKDSQLLDRFGSPRRSTGRPHTAIVVATQVIEQSLDLDFDVMISDIAPIDLLLQRSGRMHRHERGEAESERPTRLRVPQLFLTGVDWNASPPTPEAGAAAVYGSYVLLRSLAVLDGANQIQVPADIPALVQAVYAAGPVGEAQWQAALESAFEQHRAAAEASVAAAGAFLLEPVDDPGESLLNWGNSSVGGVGDEARGRATVREGNESLEVLALFRASDGSLRTAPWAADGGLPVPLNEAPGPKLERRILESSLRLPASLSKPWQIDGVIRELEASFDLPAWHGSKQLAGELVLVFDEAKGARLGAHQLHYDVNDGLAVTRDGS